jgi:hypothetical protein
MSPGQVSQFGHELRSLWNSYPSFVHRRDAELVPGEVPVFVFHTIEPGEFEAQLQYLEANSYRALTLDEFLDTQSGRRDPGPREILLTFDDARSSFWFFGFPLLRKYSFPATLFAITGWTPDVPARPNLDDTVAGGTTKAELKALDPEDRGVCSWAELSTMHGSGLVCVDSHSHLHRRVFRDASLGGAISPHDDFSPSNAAHGPYLDTDISPLGLDPQDFIGLPLFGLRGFLEDGPAVRLSTQAAAEFQKSAREHMEANDGRVSTRHLETLAELIPASACTKICESQLRREMQEDIQIARDTLRERLHDPGAGKTLCLPFTLGGKTIREIAREIGLEGIFWGASIERRCNRPGLDPMGFVRLKHDFIWRLPGDGRHSLARVYLDKVRRRLKGINPY